MLRILQTVLADDVGILANALEITAVNLNARLVGEHLHEDTGLGTVQRGANLSVVALTVLIGIQTVVVVVTGSVLNLVELTVDRVADSMRCAEIHSSTLYRLNLACGDVELVRRRKVVGIHVEHLVVGCLGEADGYRYTINYAGAFGRYYSRIYSDSYGYDNRGSVCMDI